MPKLRRQTIGSPPNHPTFVYRFFDAEERLLYVGITFMPGVRWTQHRAEKRWFKDIQRITADLYPTRDEAMAEELRAILDERPVHNGNDNPHQRLPAPTGPMESPWPFQ